MSRAALADLVDRYPWFSAARAVLLRKMLEVFGYEAAYSQYSDDRLYFPCGERISGELYASLTKGCSYKDTDAVIRDVIDNQKPVVFDGTDFFSRNDYEAVRKEEDSSISRIAVVDYDKPLQEKGEIEEKLEIISETLARIYADQGYPERAIEIYQSLSLQSPEKSAYFASLIGKLKN